MENSTEDRRLPRVQRTQAQWFHLQGPGFAYHLSFLDETTEEMGPVRTAFVRCYRPSLVGSNVTITHKPEMVVRFTGRVDSDAEGSAKDWIERMHEGLSKALDTAKKKPGLMVIELYQPEAGKWIAVGGEGLERMQAIGATHGTALAELACLMNPSIRKLSGGDRHPVPVTPANAIQYGGTHYKTRDIEPWDYITANGIGFLDGNAIKYLTRWRDKGGIEDLKKAQHYIQKLIEVTERENH